MQSQTDNESNTLLYFVLGFSLITVVVLLVLLVRCNKKTCSPYKDGTICLCSGGGRKQCANRQALKNSYMQGNNESQKFYRPPDFWPSSDFNY